MGAYDWVCGWLLLGDCFTQAASLNCKWLHGKAQSASWRKSCPCPWRYVEAPPWKLWVIHRLNWTFQNSCSNAWRKFLPWNRLRNCLALLLASIRCFWRMRIPSIGMNPVVTTFAPKSWMLPSNYGSSQRPREVLSDYWTYGRYEANTSPQMLGQFLCIFDSIIFPTFFFKYKHDFSRPLFMANTSRSLVDVWIIKHQGWAASWTEDHWYWNSAVCGEFQLHSSSAFCVLLSGDLQRESCFWWVLPTWMDEASNCIGPAHGGLREAVAQTEAGSTESGYWNCSQFGRERNSRYNTVLAKEANATSPGVQVVGEGKARIGSGADIYLGTQSAAQAISFPCSQRAI